MPAVRVPDLASEVLKLLREYPRGKFGIALGGAHAKGIEDSESDLDLYVFADSVPGNDRRSAMAREFSADISETVSWGDGKPFEQAGTDFYHGKTRVECWFRSLGFIETAIRESREGQIRKEFTSWNPMGFYNYCTLSDIYVMKPMDDPDGILKRWKAEIAEYPPNLRAAILGQFLGQAGFWPRNFHYLSAVERRDVIYCSGIAQQVLHHLIQVLFALNRRYFPGDKKLREAMSLLAIRPADSEERMEAILMPAESPKVEDLRRQRVMLADYYDEVKSLVEKHGR